MFLCSTLRDRACVFPTATAFVFSALIRSPTLPAFPCNSVVIFCNATCESEYQTQIHYSSYLVLCVREAAEARCRQASVGVVHVATEKFVGDATDAQILAVLTADAGPAASRLSFDVLASH